MPNKREYIVDGAICICDKGIKPSIFKSIVNMQVKICGRKIGTRGDKIPQVNIQSFGLCSLTKMPCQPAPIEWRGTSKAKIKGQECLLLKSKLQCGVGGMILFVNNGQI